MYILYLLIYGKLYCKIPVGNYVHTPIVLLPVCMQLLLNKWTDFKKGNTYVRYEFVSVLLLWRLAFMIALVFCVFYTMILVGIYHLFHATTVNSAFFVPLPLKFYSAIIKCIT